MKKIITSIIVLSFMSVPAFAQQHKMKHTAKNCPAKTCTDHSYDQAYSAPKGSGVEWVEEESMAKKNCPAATCTDHSYDQAYSAGRPSAAKRDMNRGKATTISTTNRSNVWTPAPTRLRDDAYSMNDYTFYGRTYKTNPDPYQGDDAPSYDGPAKNAYRNMRANNESAPLPANNGQ